MPLNTKSLSQFLKSAPSSKPVIGQHRVAPQPAAWQPGVVPGSAARPEMRPQSPTAFFMPRPQTAGTDQRAESLASHMARTNMSDQIHQLELALNAAFDQMALVKNQMAQMKQAVHAMGVPTVDVD